MKNKKGSTIVWAVMLIMVLTIIVAASLSFAYMSYHQAIKNRNKEQVELIANSAIKSLVYSIENDKISIPDSGNKEIKKMTLVDTNNNPISNYGTISNINIKRKDTTSAIASLKASYLEEEYAIYAYLSIANNKWKCIQYDTVGNRDVSSNTGSTEQPGEDSGNTGGSTTPSAPVDTSSIAGVYAGANNVVDSFVKNFNNHNGFNSWYKQECKRMNVSYTENWIYANSNYSESITYIFNHLYNSDQMISISNEMFNRVKEISGQGYWSSSLYMHIYVTDNNTGDYVLTYNQHNGTYNSNLASLIYVDGKLYVNKVSLEMSIDGKSYQDIQNMVKDENQFVLFQ